VFIGEAIRLPRDREAQFRPLIPTENLVGAVPQDPVVVLGGEARTRSDSRKFVGGYRTDPLDPVEYGIRVEHEGGVEANPVLTTCRSGSLRPVGEFTAIAVVEPGDAGRNRHPVILEQARVEHDDEEPLRENLAVRATKLGNIGMSRVFLARNHEIAVNDRGLDERATVDRPCGLDKGLVPEERPDARNELAGSVSEFLAEVTRAGGEDSRVLGSRPDELLEGVLALSETSSHGMIDRFAVSVHPVRTGPMAQVDHRRGLDRAETRIQGHDGRGHRRTLTQSRTCRYRVRRRHPVSEDSSTRRSHLRWPVIGRLAPPFGDDYIPVEATGALFLVAAVGAALAWANLAPESYTVFWARHLSIGIGSVAVDHTLEAWVSEGLMTLFFFVLGLELKRELTIGSLRHPRAALLPIGAAFGGAILPAAIFTAIVAGGPGRGGWAIPMATDAALALGVLTALGPRIRAGAKTLLLTIAIVDDLIAILVIAFFLSGGVVFEGLIGAAAAVGSVVLLRLVGVRNPWFYVPSGVALWLALGAAGIHPTIAGAALGLLAPARTTADSEILGRVERHVHPWTALLVVPLFALSAVGIEITGSTLRGLVEPVGFGVAVGLVVGKSIGILVTALIFVRLGLAVMPPGTGVGDLAGVAILGGVGLSVALFITDLALSGIAATQATMGLLVGSVLSAALGAFGFILLGRRRSRAATLASGTMDPGPGEEEA